MVAVIIHPVLLIIWLPYWNVTTSVRCWYSLSSPKLGHPGMHMFDLFRSAFNIDCTWWFWLAGANDGAVLNGAQRCRPSLPSHGGWHGRGSEVQCQASLLNWHRGMTAMDRWDQLAVLPRWNCMEFLLFSLVRSVLLVRQGLDLLLQHAHQWCSIRNRYNKACYCIHNWCLYP